MIFVTWWTFQTCCSLLGMLGIFGEVGRPNSMKPLPGPKFLKSKVFENKFFRSLLRLFLRPKFSRPIPRLFLRPKFSRPIPRLFFETKYFRDRYRDFFSRLNIFETDTETFFRDQNFRDRDRYSQKIEKSLDTEKSRDEMSHSARHTRLIMKYKGCLELL